MDEYYKLDESMASECFKQFVHTIIALFQPMHLKEPTHEQQLEINAKQ
jgi:hypothetical protein